MRRARADLPAPHPGAAASSLRRPAPRPRPPPVSPARSPRPSPPRPPPHPQPRRVTWPRGWPEDTCPAPPLRRPPAPGQCDGGSGGGARGRRVLQPPQCSAARGWLVSCPPPPRPGPSAAAAQEPWRTVTRSPPTPSGAHSRRPKPARGPALPFPGLPALCPLLGNILLRGKGVGPQDKFSRVYSERLLLA